MNDTIKDARLSACASCEAPIKWIRTENGKAAPVDATPTKVFAATGIIHDDPRGDTPEARLVAGYTSHFATCPNAPQHRHRTQQPEHIQETLLEDQ